MSEGRVLIHPRSALSGAEEEGVLVPGREHREAATAGRTPRKQGKSLAMVTVPVTWLYPKLKDP